MINIFDAIGQEIVDCTFENRRIQLVVKNKDNQNKTDTYLFDVSPNSDALISGKLIGEKIIEIKKGVYMDPNDGRLYHKLSVYTISGYITRWNDTGELL